MRAAPRLLLALALTLALALVLAPGASAARSSKRLDKDPRLGLSRLNAARPRLRVSRLNSGTAAGQRRPSNGNGPVLLPAVTAKPKRTTPRPSAEGCREAPSAQNVNIRCEISRGSCQAECKRGQEFPGGRTQLQLVCRSGFWVVKGSGVALPRCSRPFGGRR